MLIFRLLIVLLCCLTLGCSSAPPVQIEGEWEGYLEPAMDTKTGLTLSIKQTGAETKGDFSCTQVSNLGGSETEKGTFTGKVTGKEACFRFQTTPLDLDSDVNLELGEENGKPVLAGIVMHEGGLGTKYKLKKK